MLIFFVLSIGIIYINQENMFTSAPSFNQDISNWVVSRGTNFAGMFFRATSFNQDISNWDVSQATNFEKMFYEALSFDQDLSQWPQAARDSCIRSNCQPTSPSSSPTAQPSKRPSVVPSKQPSTKPEPSKSYSSTKISRVSYFVAQVQYIYRD